MVEEEMIQQSDLDEKLWLLLGCMAASAGQSDQGYDRGVEGGQQREGYFGTRQELFAFQGCKKHSTREFFSSLQWFSSCLYISYGRGFHI